MYCIMYATWWKNQMREGVYLLRARKGNTPTRGRPVKTGSEKCSQTNCRMTGFVVDWMSSSGLREPSLCHRGI